MSEQQFAPIWNNLIEISIEGPRHRGVKIQKHPPKKTLSSVNYSILTHDQHLSFTVNTAWNTWAGIGGAKCAVDKLVAGEWGWGGCCWQAHWKSDDKYSQSDSYFGFCQLEIRSWADTFISASLCLGADLSPRPLPPSFLWSQRSPPEGHQPATAPK